MTSVPMLSADYRAHVVDSTVYSEVSTACAIAWEELLIAESGMLGATFLQGFGNSFPAPHQMRRTSLVTLDGVSMGLRVWVVGDIGSAGAHQYGYVWTTLQAVRVTPGDDWWESDEDILVTWSLPASMGLNKCAEELQDEVEDIRKLKIKLEEAAIKARSEWRAGTFAELITYRLGQ